MHPLGPTVYVLLFWRYSPNSALFPEFPTDLLHVDVWMSWPTRVTSQNQPNRANWSMKMGHSRNILRKELFSYIKCNWSKPNANIKLVGNNLGYFFILMLLNCTFGENIRIILLLWLAPSSWMFFFYLLLNMLYILNLKWIFACSFAFPFGRGNSFKFVENTLN